jgi:hypothetical protein
VDLDNVFLFAGMATEAAVIALLLYRRVWRTLPVFCVYIVWCLVSDIGNYIVQHFYPASYFTSYFVVVILDSVLEFGVLVELAWSVLRPLRASLPSRTLVVIGVLVVVAGAAIWPFTGIHGLAGFPPAWRDLVRLEQTTSVLRILFFLVLAGCSQLLSIGWRDRELQVATGLGVYSFVSVTVEVLRSHQGMGPQYVFLNKLVVASYLLSLLYWVFSFATKEAERREFTPQMQNFLLAVAGTARSSRIALAEASKSRNIRD